MYIYIYKFVHLNIQIHTRMHKDMYTCMNEARAALQRVQRVQRVRLVHRFA